jgi:hypothetical protein
MNSYEYKVKIDADNPEQAKEVLRAMFDLMKTVRSELSTDDFIRFSKTIKEKPALIHSAKFFIR